MKMMGVHVVSLSSASLPISISLAIALFKNRSYNHLQRQKAKNKKKTAGIDEDTPSTQPSDHLKTSKKKFPESWKNRENEDSQAEILTPQNMIFFFGLFRAAAIMMRSEKLALPAADTKHSLLDAM